MAPSSEAYPSLWGSGWRRWLSGEGSKERGEGRRMRLDRDLIRQQVDGDEPGPSILDLQTGVQPRAACLRSALGT